jgi:AcrR family transcriptional regulator
MTTRPDDSAAPERGRPKPMRADALRNQKKVLDAAREAFATQGLAVPLDEIARRAGVGAGTVYRHYATKDALFGAVILGLLETLRDQARALRDAPDPGGAFFEFFSQLIEQGSRDKALFDAISGAGSELQAACATTSEELSDALAQLLTHAQRAGAVRQDITAIDLKAVIVGALAAQATTDDAGSRARLRSLACDGLRP